MVQLIKILLLLFVLKLKLIKINGVGVDSQHGVNLNTLKQAQIIFRHGLRSPTAPYPGDPYSSEHFWPEGWGSLTNLGKRQQYELGQYIRSRYDGFLPSQYSPKDFYCLSSDSDRAIMSALANIAGIYPPNSNAWHHHVTHWQPIPVHTLPRHIDRTILGTAPCPKFDLLWHDLLSNDPKVKKFNEENKNLYNLIASHTLENYSYPINLTKFYEALIIQEAHNFSLPEWTREIYPSKNSTNLLSFAFSLVVFTEQMKRLRGGPLVHEIFKNIQNFIEKNNSKKLILFSGHDITLARILDTLNLFEWPHLPTFNSFLIVELHKSHDQEEYFVEFHYRNDSSTYHPLEIYPRQCPKPCNLNKLQNILKNRVPSLTQWELECFEKIEDNFLTSFWRQITQGLDWFL